MIGRSNTCDTARAWSSAAADGELSVAEAAWLDAHLASCAACAAYTVELDWLVRELRAAPLAEPALPAFQPAGRPRRRPLRAAQYAVAAAAVLGAVGLGHLAATLGSQHGGRAAVATAAAAATREAPFEQTLLAMVARQLPHGRTIAT